MNNPYPAGSVVSVLIGPEPVKLPKQKYQIWKAFLTADVRWELSNDGVAWFPVDAFEQFDIELGSLDKWLFRSDREVELKALLLGPEA